MYLSWGFTRSWRWCGGVHLICPIRLVTESLIVPGLSLGVVLVEVRNDGQRPQQISRLLGCGMRYVGQLEARGSMTNRVIDDVYVNMSHLRRYLPTSVALGALGQELGSQLHRLEPR